jgi:hypothetical protein
LSYYEICDKISRGWAVEWHNDNHVPYGMFINLSNYLIAKTEVTNVLLELAYHENEWVGFDNTQSLREKVRVFFTFSDTVMGFFA